MIDTGGIVPLTFVELGRYHQLAENACGFELIYVGGRWWRSILVGEKANDWIMITQKTI